MLKSGSVWLNVDRCLLVSEYSPCLNLRRSSPHPGHLHGRLPQMGERGLNRMRLVFAAAQGCVKALDVRFQCKFLRNPLLSLAGDILAQFRVGQ